MMLIVANKSSGLPGDLFFSNTKTVMIYHFIPIGYLFGTVIPIRLVSSPTENLVVGGDADHRRQGSPDAKYLSKQYYTTTPGFLNAMIFSLLPTIQTKSSFSKTVVDSGFNNRTFCRSIPITRPSVFSLMPEE